MQEGQRQRKHRLRWWPTAWAETLCAAVLLLLARARLSRSWALRPVASEASSGCRGLAWVEANLEAV
eukprot:2997901-Lingulodinium_polyedra.AAC.1